MKAENCRICKGSELSVILDYGNVALADSFLNSKNEIINEKKYPLKLCFCENCKHLQIDEIIPPELLYKNYVYETGVSKSILGFADDLCQKLLACYYANSPQKQPAVLEIASNDGTVLSVFQDNGCKVLGIDPAENLVKIANSRGVKSLASFFNLQNANKILEEYGKWNICLARNVLAHVSELHSLVNGIKTVLADDGFAIVEVPHIKTMFEQLQYDQVFHEHIGFHSFDSLQRLFNMFDMEAFDVEEVWIHGGSIRVYLQHKKGPRAISANVLKMLEMEKEIGLFEKSSWEDFARKVYAQKTALQNELNQLISNNNKIAIYGASGKGQSLIQFCGLDNNTIEYVVDKSSLKHHKMTPGSHIPIYPTEYIYENMPDVVLLCAWNFADEILKQEERYISLGGKILHPLPMPHYLV